METASEQMTKPVTESVTDSLGRSIVVRKPRSLDRMKVFELIGADNAKNEPYLGYAVLAYAVTSIDGSALPVPTTKIALEAVVKRLDDDGILAVSKAFAKFNPASEDEAKETVKN
jgi:hypothetical protein